MTKGKSGLDAAQFRVSTKKKVDLEEWPTLVKPVYGSKKEYRKLLHAQVVELSALQRLHYASNRFAVLVIFQAMDAAGKDGAIRHVMSGVNPQGCQVFSFKHPSATELEHDFLWRATRSLPHTLKLRAPCQRIKAVAGGLFSCTIQVFHESEWDAALSFLTAPEERTPMPYRLLADKGVLILEPQGALREQDFEAVAAAVDPWIETHGSLHGVVVRASEFPGWEDVGGLMSHLRFVRDHHQKVRRVALVADTRLAAAASKLVTHFVAAEVKHFPYDQFDDALSWAEQDLKVSTGDQSLRSHAS